MQNDNRRATTESELQSDAFEIRAEISFDDFMDSLDAQTRAKVLKVLGNAAPMHVAEIEQYKEWFAVPVSPKVSKLYDAQRPSAETDADTEKVGPEIPWTTMPQPCQPTMDLLVDERTQLPAIKRSFMERIVEGWYFLWDALKLVFEKVLIVGLFAILWALSLTVAVLIGSALAASCVVAVLVAGVRHTRAADQPAGTERAATGR